MAYFSKGLSCCFEYCKRCDNNAGGVCAYDLEAEAQTLGKTLDQIRNADNCLFFDPIERED